MNANYKVCILAAGIGSRMQEFTKSFNKSLLPVQGKPAICHIVEKFNESTEIVIAVGYKKETVIDYLTTAYPKRKLTFIEVDKFSGPGTGPGYSLLQCKEALQCPFVFFAADTLVKEEIPQPVMNWFGVATIRDAKRFCSAKVENGKVTQINDKVDCDNKHGFIGLAGVRDYMTFWERLEQNKRLIDNEIQVSNGFSALIEKGLVANSFTWFDVGTVSAYAYTMQHFPHGSGYIGE